MHLQVGNQASDFVAKIKRKRVIKPDFRLKKDPPFIINHV